MSNGSPKTAFKIDLKVSRTEMNKAAVRLKIAGIGGGEKCEFRL